MTRDRKTLERQAWAVMGAHGLFSDCSPEGLACRTEIVSKHLDEYEAIEIFVDDLFCSPLRHQFFAWVIEQEQQLLAENPWGYIF